MFACMWHACCVHACDVWLCLVCDVCRLYLYVYLYKWFCIHTFNYVCKSILVLCGSIKHICMPSLCVCVWSPHEEILHLSCLWHRSWHAWSCQQPCRACKGWIFPVYQSHHMWQNVITALQGACLLWWVKVRSFPLCSCAGQLLHWALSI